MESYDENGRVLLNSSELEPELVYEIGGEHESVALLGNSYVVRYHINVIERDRVSKLSFELDEEWSFIAPSDEVAKVIADDYVSQIAKGHYKAEYTLENLLKIVDIPLD